MRWSGRTTSGSSASCAGRRSARQRSRSSPGSPCSGGVARAPPAGGGKGRPLIVLVLVLVADEVQLARLDPAGRAPVHQRVLAAVGDPHLARGQFLDRLRQLVPV